MWWAKADFDKFTSPHIVRCFFAEDWVIFEKGSVDWIDFFYQFYQHPRSGVQYPADKIRDVLRRRKNGDLSVSVSSFSNSTCT